jgi:hypothetical protein
VSYSFEVNESSPPAPIVLFFKSFICLFDEVAAVDARVIFTTVSEVVVVVHVHRLVGQRHEIKSGVSVEQLHSVALWCLTAIYYSFWCSLMFVCVVGCLSRKLMDFT